MTKLSLALTVVATAIGASLAFAQGGGYGPGPGYGPGSGYGPGAGCGMGAGVPGANCQTGGAGYGPGPGYGRGPGGGMGGGMGWGGQLLSPEEFAKHREAMHSFKTVEECNAYLAEHQKLLAERAKEKGVAAPSGPRPDACERMKARGMIG